MEKGAFLLWIIKAVLLFKMAIYVNSQKQHTLFQ